MSEEVKSTNTRKRATKPKEETTTKETTKKTTPKKETVAEPTPLELQMQQMISIMMAQQQQIAELMAKTTQVEEEVQAQPVKVVKPTPVRSREKVGRLTKQELRRKYKDTDIYLQNVTNGPVDYTGRNNKYHWEDKGDVEAITIDDLVNMKPVFLETPWLILDDYENDEELLDDVISVLKLEKAYRYLYVLNDLEEDIENIDIKELEEVIMESKQRGFNIDLDMSVIVQRKVESGELENYKLITKLGEILGRKFLI